MSHEHVAWIQLIDEALECVSYPIRGLCILISENECDSSSGFLVIWKVTLLSLGAPASILISFQKFVLSIGNDCLNLFINCNQFRFLLDEGD